jgi:Chaperone of endosialidase
MKIIISSLCAVLIFLCLAAVGPSMQAVSPAPDGGYPGFTTAEGTNALKNLVTGVGNTAVGWFSLFSDNLASYNTGVGAGTLLFNNADSNTAVGTAALLLNTTGGENTAIGVAALSNNTTPSGNTAIGSRALLNNTTGGTLGNQGIDLGPNVAVGQQALESNTVASANTAVGYQALRSFTTGPVGSETLGLCTAVGFQALANATGIANSAFGYQALVADTVGAANTAVGFFALTRNSTGDSNTANGSGALFSNTTGTENTASGADALDDNETGIANTAIGVRALEQNTTGNFNTALGENAGINVTTADNVICIGFNVFGANVAESCYIGNIFGKTAAGGSQVFINSDNKLGTITSSKRFKEDIKPMNKTSEALFSLKPVAFRYKKEIDPAGTSQLGLVAEDVEGVNPDLVVRDKEGNPYSVRYDQVNAMLLNEFLKEHRKVEEQEATIAQLKKQMETVLARLREHESKIKKVRDKIETSELETEVVDNNQ